LRASTAAAGRVQSSDERVDLDEHEAIAIAKNQVNLAARRTEIGREKFQPMLPQISSCRALAQLASPQMFRLILAGEHRFDFFRQTHDSKSELRRGFHRLSRIDFCGF